MPNGKDDAEPPDRGSSPPCDALEAACALAAAGEDELRRIGAALLADLPDAVVHAGTDGTIRYWNAGAERIFGFTSAEAVGRSLDIIIPERLRARHWEGWRHMLETGRSRYGPGELLSVPAITRAGAAISVQFTLAPVRDVHGRIGGIVALLRDVTATFAELKRLRAARGG